MKKTVCTLIVDGYAPRVTALTLPYMRRFADKIGADFQLIKDRKFPDFPAVYEKLQLYELAQDNDWAIYFDADVLVHPDLFDVTEHLSKDTVLHWGNDLAGNRWRYDRYFRRDGRHIGSGNWFTVASDWCADLWKPLDISLAEALTFINPTVRERNFGIQPEHLIDDYTLSRNIARFGLKFLNFQELQKKLNRPDETYFFHNYLMTEDEKIEGIKKHMLSWELEGKTIPESRPGEPATLSPEAQTVLDRLKQVGRLPYVEPVKYVSG